MNPLISSFEMPGDWDVCRISERYRITKKPRSLDVSAFEAVPFSPMEMVPLGGKREIEFGFKEGSDIRSGTYYEKGDFLLAKITPSFENGKQGLGGNIPLHFGYATTEVIPIQPLDERSSVEFLFYLLLHPAIRCDIANRMEGSTGRKRVPDHIVREYEIGIPKSPTEQRSIAAILSKVQEAVEVEGALIRVTRELKQAALQKLFTEGLRGEPQKETEIGLVPESWEERRLGDIFKLTSGKIRPKDTGPIKSEKAPIPVVGGNGCMGYSSQHMFANGRLLVIGRVGEYCGVIHKVEGHCWITDNALYAKEWLSNDIDFDFLAAYLLQLNLNRFKRTGGQPLVTQGLIYDLPAYFPTSISEQREIASILQTIDNKIAHHESRQKLLQELFQRLLQDLMTGVRRVNDLDVEGLLKGGAAC